MDKRPHVLIVTPYGASANNGNWRTAARWERLLGSRYRVTVRTASEGLADADVLVALHARRCHAEVAAWRERHGKRPCVVVLTGTDLYRDVPMGDAAALASLDFADRLIVLQESGLDDLPPLHRAKARVVYQSAPALFPRAKPDGRLECVFVGHLRPEKDPLILVRAAARLRHRRDVGITLIGGARDEATARRVRSAARRAPNVRLAGALTHARAREAMRRAHLLAVPSVMEGGANVVAEALTAGTPVIASRVPGNVGMLGAGYPGYFPAGDDRALARLLARAARDGRYLALLQRLGRARSRRFTRERERASLIEVLEPLLAPEAAGREEEAGARRRGLGAGNGR
ncbi:MAG: selenoneine biosynthesis selenosugar synthase SenB [Pseudomonadota bacterium]